MSAVASMTWRDWSCAVSLTVTDGRHLSGAAAVVRELMEAVDRAASRFRSDSHLTRVNENAGRLVPVNLLTFRLVGLALDAARATSGAVDPTVGASLLRLGYDDDIAAVRRRIAAAPPASAPTRSWSAVRLDRTLLRVGVPAGMRLDLGATAKAWTADEAARRIHRRYGLGVLVGLGGDLAAAGSAGRAWRVDVAETEGAPAERVGLASGGLATSSTLARRWATGDGSMAHHVVDPRTGAPADGPWRTATVWAPTTLAANVVSTWALVDAAAAVRNIAEHDRAARLVHQDGRVTHLGDWPVEEAAAS